ncbi:MAG: NADH-quinone oxidoreductase subunit N [Phycisphaerales bacterium]|nr:NADH-quinone oxidoreductase subunit N [Phycisphaerales bacterium]
MYASPFNLLAPELIVGIAGCVVLVLGAGKESMRRILPWISLAALVLAIIFVKFLNPAAADAMSDGDPQWMTIGGLDYQYRSVDGGWGPLLGPLADFVRISALIFGVLILIVNWATPRLEEAGEFFSMMLFMICGLMMMGAANDLIVLFMAIELVSVPSYIIVALSRSNSRALESATKYFYLGAFAAALTAYGMSFLYGATGTTSLGPEAMERLRQALTGVAPGGALAYGVAMVGVTLTITGLLFKLAAFPLHFYVADVYEGAASGVAGMLGFVPKLAGLMAITKVLALTGWLTLSHPGLFYTLWVVAAFSAIVGNVLAFLQTNVKRMLAYSGVAHAGYMVVGLMAGAGKQGAVFGDGPGAVLYYVMIYGIANLGAFAILGLLRRRGQACETVQDLAGLLKRSPGIALLMALAMFTLMGMPPTPGFWGKFWLFGGALSAASEAAEPFRSWYIALVIISVVTAAIGAAYYLRVIAACLLAESDEPADLAPRESLYMGAVLCGFLIIVFMLVPKTLLSAGSDASRGVMRPEVAHVEKPENAAQLASDLE